MYIWIIFKYSIFINYDLLLFWVCGTQRFFFFLIRLLWLSITSLQLALPSRFPIDCQRTYWDWRKCRELFFRKSRIILRTDLQHSCDLKCAIFPYLGGEDFFFFFFFVRFFHSHCFSLLSLTFSALCMWPEVALLVTGCSNEITKSSVALWLTGVFRLMLM